MTTNTAVRINRNEYTIRFTLDSAGRHQLAVLRPIRALAHRICAALIDAGVDAYVESCATAAGEPRVVYEADDRGPSLDEVAALFWRVKAEIEGPVRPRYVDLYGKLE